MEDGLSVVLSMWFRNQSPDRTGALPPVLDSSIPEEAPICLRLTSGGEMEGLKNLRIL